MKKIFFSFFLSLFSIFANAFVLSNVTVSAINTNDINVAITVGYSYSFEMNPPVYVISGNTITVTVCCFHGGLATYSYITRNQIIPNINVNISTYNLIVNIREIINADPCITQPIRSTATMNFGTPVIGLVVLNKSSFDIQRTMVYPNPNKGFFIVKSLQNFDLKIYDILGHELFDKKNIDENFEIQSNLSKGVYILKIFNKDGTIATNKFVVE